MHYRYLTPMAIPNYGCASFNCRGYMCRGSLLLDKSYCYKCLCLIPNNVFKNGDKYASNK
jgi:hypothetical protein